MDSGIIRTGSISSRNRDRAAARREVQEELNLAHMEGLMKDVRYIAHRKGSGRSRVVLEEHAPSKPVLRIETDSKICPEYYKLGPSITEKRHGRVSTSIRGEDADQRQNAEERRLSQKGNIPLPKHTDLFEAVEEYTKQTPALRRQRPTLKLRADFATTPEYHPKDPQAPKNKHRRLNLASERDSNSHQTAHSRRRSQAIKESQPKETSCSPAVEERSKSPASKGGTDRRQTSQSRSYSQRIMESQPKDSTCSPVAEEQWKSPASKRDTDRRQTAQSRSYSQRIMESQPKDSTFSPAAGERSRSPASKGDTDRCQAAQSRSYSQRIKESQPKGGTVSPEIQEQQEQSPTLTRQKPTLQIWTDFASAECLAQPDHGQINLCASQIEQPRVSTPIIRGDTEQCQIMEIISLYEEVGEKNKDQNLPPPIPPKSERRGKNQSRRTDEQEGITSAPKRHKPTLRIRTNTDSASRLDYSIPDTCANQQLLVYLRMNPLATEHQNVSPPVEKGSTDRCQEVKRDRSQRPRLVDIVRQGLAESEVGSPTLSPFRSASLYGDYSCIYKEYSD